jgi:hypothetical protein
LESWNLRLARQSRFCRHLLMPGISG